jgi:hypothetical protein
MPKAEEPNHSGEVILKSVIIYDDLSFVAKATATLKRVGHRAEVDARWLVRSWPANALHSVVTMDRATLEAVDAHLIVIPFPRHRTLPFHLREWLGRWAALRQIQDAALAVIDDGSQSFNHAISAELKTFVQKLGLNLILEERPVAKAPPHLAVRFPRAHELPVSSDRRRWDPAVSRHLFRSFGINE